jgi:hypothetical protein
MRLMIRSSLAASLAAFSITCAAASFALMSPEAALAQAKDQAAPAQAAPAQAAPAAQPPQMKQVALTEKQIDGVLASLKEMDPITDKLPDNVKPDPKVIAQLDGIAKKNGFASYDDFNNVIDNIGLVLGGFDPASKKYVGPEAVIKSQIAEVEADKKMAAKDKKEALDELNAALKSPPPAIENKANIDLVAKHYDQLAAALGGDQ